MPYFTSTRDAQASEAVESTMTGPGLEIAFNPQFLLDGVGAIHSPFVRIAFTNSDNPNKPGPVLLTSQTSRDEGESTNYRYLLQPNLLMR